MEGRGAGDGDESHGALDISGSSNAGRNGPLPTARARGMSSIPVESALVGNAS